MNKRIIGAAGFVFCTALTLSIMLACADDKDSSSNSEKDSKVKESVSLPKAGEIVKTDKFEITLTSVSVSGIVGDKYFGEKAPEGAIFLIVNYKSKNITKETISAYDLPKIESISDPNGTTYSEAASATMYYKTSKGIDEKLISKLNPGITEKNAVIFEVSSDLWKNKGWKALVKADKEIEFELK